jgi:hypothetical protein
MGVYKLTNGGTLSITGRPPAEEEERQIDFLAWKALLGNSGRDFEETCKEIGEQLGIDREYVGAQLWHDPLYVRWADKNKVEMIRLRSTRPTPIRSTAQVRYWEPEDGVPF